MANVNSLGELEIEVSGSKQEQQLGRIANLIMKLGMLYQNNKETVLDNKSYVLDIVNNDVETWRTIENLILNKIENYIKHGASNEANDDKCFNICYGTLLFLDQCYSDVKDARSIQTDRVQNNLNKLGKNLEDFDYSSLNNRTTKRQQGGFKLQDILEEFNNINVEEELEETL